MENKFKKAIEMNELYEFIRGEGDYLIYDREYGRHCILGAWEYHIIPFIDLSEGKYIKQIFHMYYLNHLCLLIHNDHYS